jgi:anti-anti-sigma factor
MAMARNPSWNAPEEGHMLIDIEWLDSVCILHCKGRFVAGPDMDYVQTKLQEIKRLGCSRVLANFEEVTSLGSIGITFIVGTYTSAMRRPGGRFVLVGARSTVQSVLNLTRLSTVIPQAVDVPAGMAFLAAPSLVGDGVGQSRRAECSKPASP